MFVIHEFIYQQFRGLLNMISRIGKPSGGAVSVRKLFGWPVKRKNGIVIRFNRKSLGARVCWQTQIGQIVIIVEIVITITIISMALGSIIRVNLRANSLPESTIRRIFDSLLMEHDATKEAISLFTQSPRYDWRLIAAWLGHGEQIKWDNGKHRMILLAH